MARSVSANVRFSSSVGGEERFARQSRETKTVSSGTVSCRLRKIAKTAPAEKGSQRSHRRQTRTFLSSSFPAFTADRIRPAQSEKGARESGESSREAKAHSTASRSVLYDRGTPFPRSAPISAEEDGSDDSSVTDGSCGRKASKRNEEAKSGQSLFRSRTRAGSRLSGSASQI